MIMLYDGLDPESDLSTRSLRSLSELVGGNREVFFKVIRTSVTKRNVSEQHFTALQGRVSHRR